MAERITIQDIADALGFSRNTVSKAINNTGSLSDATRERILNKAVEMGYKQFSFLSLSDNLSKNADGDRVSSFSESTKPPILLEKNQIALFAGKTLGSSHFSSTMLDKFQREISRLGFALSMYLISPEEMQEKALPRGFQAEATAGIICFEVFDPEYSRMLCECPYPILFVDGPALPLRGVLQADLLVMDNLPNIFSFVSTMAHRGKDRIGFIGEPLHCQSFYERYRGFRDGLEYNRLPYNRNFCIFGLEDGKRPDHFTEYRDYLAQSLENMAKSQLPDVFICANDFIAIDVIQICRKQGISIPDDIWLCGFDDSQESRIITPTLTTVHIHSQIMGTAAAELLISRIREPSLNHRTVHTETKLILRESTGDCTEAD